MAGNFVGGIIGAAIGTTVGLIGSIKGIRDTQKAMRKSYIRQMEILIQNYNYNQNALDQESRFNLESAKQNLFNITFNGIQNNSAVFAAQGETGYEGRTGQQIARAITGQVERRRTGVIENYQQQDYQIRRERDNLYIQTQKTVEQAEDNFNNMQTSDLENVFNVMHTSAMAGYQGFMIGSGIGGGFGGGFGGGAGASGAGSGSINLNGLGSSGALSTGASGASSAGSFSLSAGGGGSGMSSGWSWNRAMQSFNQVYSQQSSIQNMFSQFGALGQSLGALFGNTRNNRYNFIY
jgi:hypothetical protein